jgi:hypothetical protein
LSQIVFHSDSYSSLLDLIYLSPKSDKKSYLEELRLQNLDILDPDRLTELATRSGKPKLQRTAKKILLISRTEEYESL